MENKEIQIAESIRTLRRGKGISQEVLAEAMNVSVQAVSKWELGLSTPDALMLPRIAGYFGVTLDELYYGLKEDIPPTESPSPDPAPEPTSDPAPDSAPEPTADPAPTDEDPDRPGGGAADGSGSSSDGERANRRSWDFSWIGDTVNAALGGLDGLGEKIRDQVENSMKRANFAFRFEPKSGNEPPIQLEHDGDLELGDIPARSVLTVHGSLSCGDIGENACVEVDGDVDCGDIGSHACVEADGDVNCGDVGMNACVEAGGDVDCGEVAGDAYVEAGGDVNADYDVYGRIKAGGDVDCGDIGSHACVEADGDVNCNEVYGCVQSGGSVNCNGEKENAREEADGDVECNSRSDREKEPPIVREVEGDFEMGDVPKNSRLIVHGNLTCGAVMDKSHVTVDGKLTCKTFTVKFGRPKSTAASFSVVRNVPATCNAATFTGSFAPIGILSAAPSLEPCRPKGT